MRIAINGRLLIENRLEGLGYFTWEVLKRMVDLYPEHDYLVLFDRKPARAFLIPGVEFRILRPAARHPFLYLFWFDVLVPIHLRTWDAEVFVSFDGFTSQRLHIPVVTTIHDLAYLHYPEYMKSADLWYYKKFQPKFARLSTGLLTVSEYSAKDLEKQYNIKRNEIEVVYNGSRFENNPPESRPAVLEKYGVQAHQYFIYTGSLHPRKNIIRLVEAFEHAQAAKAGIKLVLAGRSAWKTQEIMERIDRSPVSVQIIRTGYVSDTTLWNLLKNSLSLCYVSLFEGFGVPVLDAFHAGVPVICSSTTSVAEVAGDASLLVHPEDVQAISAAMDRVYLDAGIRQSLVESGHERKSRFSWRSTTKLIYETIEESYRNFRI